jgi:hypothetical protein
MRRRRGHLIRSLLALAAFACTPADPKPSEEVQDEVDDTAADTGESFVDDGTFVAVSTASDAKGGDIAIADDGTIYITWVQDDRVWLTHSTDVGETWAAGTPVTGDVRPTVVTLSHPTVRVHGDRVVVSLASGGMWTYTADRSELDFAEHKGIGVERDDLQYEDLFLRTAIAPGGEVWTSFHAFPADSWDDGWKGVGRESNAFDPETAVAGAPGLPCECCSHDLTFDGDGNPLLAYRNNVDDLREITVARGRSDGTWESWTQVSQDDWNIDYCPTQGPRFSGAGDTLLVAWSEGASTVAKVHAARTEDGGATWLPQVAMAPAGEQVQYDPTIALSEDGRAWAAFDVAWGGADLVRSTDGGATWSEPEGLEAPDGRLHYPEIAANAGIAGLAGATNEGGLWFRRLE